MKFSFEFRNLLGTAYKKGNVHFTADGNCLLSPVGSRITVYDLKNCVTKTLPFQNKKNIARIALLPNSDQVLLSVDEGIPPRAFQFS